MFHATTLSRSLLTIGALIAVPVLFTGCGASDYSGEPQQAAALIRAPFDGETIFRGLFFGVGPAADRLSPLWNDARIKSQIARLSSLSSDAQADAIDVAVKKMVADAWSPSSIAGMKQLAKDLRSGSVKEPSEEQRAATREFLLSRIRSADPTFFDHFGVALQGGDHVRIERFLDEGARLLRVAMDTGLTPSPDTAARPVVYTKVAVATRAAVAAIIIVVAIVIVWVNDPALEGSTLAKEEFVAHVAKALAVR